MIGLFQLKNNKFFFLILIKICNVHNLTRLINKIFYSLTLPAVRPLTKYFSKYMKIKSTGKVTITDQAIKY